MAQKKKSASVRVDMKKNLVEPFTPFRVVAESLATWTVNDVGKPQIPFSATISLYQACVESNPDREEKPQAMFC